MEKEMIMTKIRYFFNNCTKVHIKKHDGRFFNGTILKLEDAGIILKDRKLGEYPIFFMEIDEVEPFTEGEQK